ncbi:DUF2207 domain-containing protein [Aestuariimicrobium soli]|uniref:DUF2207 domain-containing protein n=1 Tax=Aestuariimicrobium soli TaxID=2035834 RepID=UPI003EC0541E
MLRTLGSWIRYPIIIALVMLAAAIPAWWKANRHDTGTRTSADNFVINSFVGDYTPVVRSDGTTDLEVREEFVVTFANDETNHGIVRFIPTGYQDHTTPIGTVTVTGRVTTTRPYEPDDPQVGTPDYQVSREDGVVVVRIGSATRYAVAGEHQTYQLSYTIRDVALNAPDRSRQQLYVDTIGTRWRQPVESLTARIHLGGDLAAATDGSLACYRGAEGSTDTCAISRSGDTVTASTSDLEPGEQLTWAVGFANGTFERAYTPSTQVDALGLLGRWWVWLVPAAGLLALAVQEARRAWFHHVGRPKVIVTQVTPPEGVPVFASADIMGREALGPAAMLMDLVVRKVSTITSDEPAAAPDAGAGHPTDRERLSWWQRRKLRKSLVLETGDLTQAFPDELERAATAALFGGTVPVNRDDEAWEPAAQDEYRAGIVVDRGWRDWPPNSPAHFMPVFVCLYLTAGITVFASGLLGTPFWVYVALAVVGVVALVASIYRTPYKGRLTDEGRAVRDHLLGLRQFMTLAETERIQWLQNVVDAPRENAQVTLYEPLLPYALIFGIEKTWAQVIGEQLRAAPDLAGPDGSWAAQLAGWGGSYSDLTSAMTSRRRRHHYVDNDAGRGLFSSMHERAAQSASDFGEGLSQFASDLNELSSSSNDGTSSSWSSSSSRSSRGGGSSGGGRSGGGVGGGGGGGW